MSALVALFSAAKSRVAATTALGLMTTVVLGFGRFGSNYGAAAAAVVTFGLILTALRKGGFGARHVIGLVSLGVIVSLTFACADWLAFGTSGSHGAQVVGGGLGNVLTVAWRKALMNVHLAASRTARQAVLAILPFVALWLWRIHPKICEILAQDPRLKAGLKALMVGAAAAMVMNDSGVVMAGIMVSMTAVVLVYTLLEQLAIVEDCSA
ncbi:MAG: hypothetical protein ACPL7K_01535, partial [Armatimonadota bacterium]